MDEGVDELLEYLAELEMYSRYPLIRKNFLNFYARDGALMRFKMEAEEGYRGPLNDFDNLHSQLEACLDGNAAMKHVMSSLKSLRNLIRSKLIMSSYGCFDFFIGDHCKFVFGEGRLNQLKDALETSGE